MFLSIDVKLECIKKNKSLDLRQFQRDDCLTFHALKITFYVSLE